MVIAASVVRMEAILFIMLFVSLFVNVSELPVERLSNPLQHSGTLFGPGSLFKRGPGVGIIECTQSARRNAADDFAFVLKGAFERGNSAPVAYPAKDIAALPALEIILKGIVNDFDGGANDFIANLVPLPGFLNKRPHCSKRTIGSAVFIPDSIKPCLHVRVSNFLNRSPFWRRCLGVRPFRG